MTVVVVVTRSADEAWWMLCGSAGETASEMGREGDTVTAKGSATSQHESSDSSFFTLLINFSDLVNGIDSVSSAISKSVVVCLKVGTPKRDGVLHTEGKTPPASISAHQSTSQECRGRAGAAWDSGSVCCTGS